jgi:hypothetical protein
MSLFKYEGEYGGLASWLIGGKPARLQRGGSCKLPDPIGPRPAPAIVGA